MRRIIVEMPAEDFDRLKGGGGAYRKVDALLTLAQLGMGTRSPAAIVRIAFKEPGLSPGAYFDGSGTDVEVLDEAEGIYTCLLKFHGGSLGEHLGLKDGEGYIVPPLEISDDVARLTFAGSSRQIDRFLERLAARHVRHRTVSIGDLRLPSPSPLSVLTEKQRKVLVTAYRRGYYDRPRRASSRDLAGELGVSSATLVTHRLKAERRLIRAVLEQAGPQPRKGPPSARRVGARA